MVAVEHLNHVAINIRIVKLVMFLNSRQTRKIKGVAEE